MFTYLSINLFVCLLIKSQSDCSGGRRSEGWSHRLPYCTCTALKACLALRSSLALKVLCLLYLPFYLWLVSYLTLDLRNGLNENENAWSTKMKRKKGWYYNWDRSIWRNKLRSDENIKILIKNIGYGDINELLISDASFPWSIDFKGCRYVR